MLEHQRAVLFEIVALRFDQVEGEQGRPMSTNTKEHLRALPTIVRGMPIRMKTMPITMSWSKIRLYLLPGYTLQHSQYAPLHLRFFPL